MLSALFLRRSHGSSEYLAVSSDANKLVLTGRSDWIVLYSNDGSWSCTCIKKESATGHLSLVAHTRAASISNNLVILSFAWASFKRATASFARRWGANRRSIERVMTDGTLSPCVMMAYSYTRSAARQCTYYPACLQRTCWLCNSIRASRARYVCNSIGCT